MSLIGKILSIGTAFIVVAHMLRLLLSRDSEPTPAEQVAEILEQAHYACVSSPSGSVRQHCMKEVCLLQDGPETVCNSLTMGYEQ